MSYPTQFLEWLNTAERDGQGGLKAEPPAIRLGEPLAFTANFPEHSIYGDWTTGAFEAALRAAPGAAGDVLAEYSVSVGTPASDLTPVTLTLASADQGDLPPLNASTGLAEVFLAISYTPAGGSRKTIIDTRQLVRGAV